MDERHRVDLQRADRHWLAAIQTSGYMPEMMLKGNINTIGAHPQVAGQGTVAMQAKAYTNPVRAKETYHHITEGGGWNSHGCSANRLTRERQPRIADLSTSFSGSEQ